MTSRSPFLTRIVGYGLSRTGVQILFAGRGLLLAGLLGPELLGVWTLFRIGLRYLAFAALGSQRGLELEVSRSAHDEAGRTEQILWGRAMVAQTTLLFGALSVAAAAAWFWPSHGIAHIAFLGIASGLMLDRLWAYGLTYLRASGGLRRFAVLELLHAAMQAAACISLALVWGLPGAFAGFAAANLGGLLALNRRVPWWPRLDLARIRQLIRIGLPVSAMGMITATLVTADRLLVGAFLGLGGLGIYAFAVSVSDLGVSFAAVIRTVILREVYSTSRQDGDPEAEGSVSLVLDKALVGFATLAPPLLAVLALLMPFAIELVAEDYRAAAPAAQLLLFAGLIQGLINVALLGVVVAERQQRLPLLATAALTLNVTLSTGALLSGLGIQGVAAAALATQIIYAAAVFVLLAPNPTAPIPIRLIGRVLFPTLWCAFAVFAIGRIFPIADLRTLMIEILCLAGALLVLIRPVLRALLPSRALENT